jgi:hypothetical protein
MIRFAVWIALALSVVSISPGSGASGQAPPKRQPVIDVHMHAPMRDEMIYML